MRERLEEALRAGDAEYVDIRIEDVVSTRIEFQGESLDQIGSSRKLGGIVRAGERRMGAIRRSTT